jgi:hypothetical protein
MAIEEYGTLGEKIYELPIIRQKIEDLKEQIRLSETRAFNCMH